METPNILIAHDHEMYTLGLKTALQENGYGVDAVIDQGPHALEFILKKEPQLVIVKEVFSEISAFEMIRTVAEAKVNTRFVIVYPNCDQRGILLSQWAGANGSVHLGDSFLTHARCIRKVLAGDNYYSCSFFSDRLDRSVLNMVRLSQSERKVLKMISAHDCSEKIASNLNLSKRTIEKHRSNIIMKLDLDKKTNSLLQWALKNKPYVDSLAFGMA